MIPTDFTKNKSIVDNIIWSWHHAKRKDEYWENPTRVILRIYDKNFKEEISKENRMRLYLWINGKWFHQHLGRRLDTKKHLTKILGDKKCKKKK